jgi:hypothetical protein
MFGLTENEQSASSIESGIHTRDASNRVYTYLCAMVIAVARDCETPCVLIAVTAPDKVLRERVQMRAKDAHDASDIL